MANFANCWEFLGSSFYLVSKKSTNLLDFKQLLKWQNGKSNKATKLLPMS